MTGIVLKGVKSKSNKLSRNIKKTYYSKTGIILLSFGTASKKCFLQRNLYISFNHKHRQCKKHRECTLDLYFLHKHHTKLKYETFTLRNFIWEKLATLSTPTKSFNFSYFSRIFKGRELKCLKCRKAARCDDRLPGILKGAVYALSSSLTNLINI